MFSCDLNLRLTLLHASFQVFHARLNNDLVVVSQLEHARHRKIGHPLPPLPGEARPKSTILQESSMTQNVRLRNSVGNKQDLPEKPGSVSSASCSSTPLPGRKARPMSTGGRVESSIPETIHEFKESEREDNRSQLRLLMYIVGGREVGQVTVFKRPISMWKLDLTKTF